MMKLTRPFATLACIALGYGAAQSQTIVVSPSNLSLRADACAGETTAEGQVSVVGVSSENVPFAVDVTGANDGSADWLTVQPQMATTPATIRVMANGEIGAGSATITVTATQGGAGSTVNVSFLVDRPRQFNEPASLAGVVSGAGFRAGVAPGGIASLFGDRLSGESAATEFVSGSDPLRLPTEYCDFEVVINGVPAPLFFVSEGQVNLQIPYEVSPGLATLVVKRGGMSSPPLDLPVDTWAPSVFTSGGGPNSIVEPIVIGTDGTINFGGPPQLSPGGAIVFMTTGHGALSPPVRTGEVSPASPLSWSAADLTATFGDAEGEILYQGATPGWVGLSQVNVLVPDLDFITGPRIFELRTDGVLIATFGF